MQRNLSLSPLASRAQITRPQADHRLLIEKAHERIFVGRCAAERGLSRSDTVAEGAKVKAFRLAGFSPPKPLVTFEDEEEKDVILMILPVRGTKLESFK